MRQPPPLESTYLTSSGSVPTSIVRVYKVRSYLLLFGDFSWAKSSHLIRNDCYHEFRVKKKKRSPVDPDFAIGWLKLVTWIRCTQTFLPPKFR